MVQTQNNFDAERGCFNVHRAIVEYIKEKDPDVWKANETQPVEKQRPPPQSMNKHEYARLIHCYISPENMTQLESLTQSLNREALDARKSAGHVEPWQVITDMFESNRQFDNPDPSKSRIKAIDPNSRRIGRDPNTVKRCYKKLIMAFSIVYTK
ncbi:MAG: hypothetical protein ACREOZ_04100 [Gloeomargaritales cyanobacterium]